MGTPPTLADLVADPGELIALCQNSHHDAVLPVASVLARYGPTTPFPDVMGRFCCLIGLRPLHGPYLWA
jgi:hypothetical protein